MSLFDGKCLFTVNIYTFTGESDLWGVSFCEGEALIHHSKDRRVVVLADAKRLAREKDIQVACTLEHFFNLTVESEVAGTETWATSEGYLLVWSRASYSGDRQGLDHLTVRKGDQDLGEFCMYHDTDAHVVEEILRLIAPGSNEAEVSGYLLEMDE